MDRETNIGDGSSLFDDGTRFARSTAWACVVYSLVPFLGVLFVPIAFVYALIEYRKAGSNTPGGDRRNKLLVFPAAALIGACQLVLWWLLYVIPDLGR